MFNTYHAITNNISYLVLSLYPFSNTTHMYSVISPDVVDLSITFIFFAYIHSFSTFAQHLHVG
jgi:hypothetical protein